ncbi:MAG: MASE1 domain-containing protein, partial [Myxococcaceae bacterium]|nr:MASE1 domain-containing protein [Myxococcaceae bacterium]
MNGSLRSLLPLVAFGAAYLAGAELGHWVSGGAGFATFWPNSGLFLAALLRAPRARWPLFLAAGLAANLLSNWVHGQPWPASIAFCVANAAEAAMGAALLERLLGPAPKLSGLKTTMMLLLVPVVTSVPLAAVVAAVVGSATFGAPFRVFVEAWWAADALGVVVATPLVLLLVDVREAPARARVAELVVLLLALGGAAAWVFLSSRGATPTWLLLVMAAITLRLRSRGVALAAMTLAVLAGYFTNRGHGLFALTGSLLERTAA